jgi:uncharacterized membrane protein YdjX (TVP38/TMEM64 family)
MAIGSHVRFPLALGVLVVGVLLARALGLTDALSAERARGYVQAAGSLGPVVFTAFFVVSTLAQIPGIPFILLAPALFPLPEAIAICLPASHVAVALNFELARRVGGSRQVTFTRPWLTRVFSHLDADPVRTVILLRAVTIMFPPVTTALALTHVSRRAHTLGTLLGMTPSVLALLLLAGFLLHP